MELSRRYVQINLPNQGVQRPGKPGNVGEIQCKKKKSEKSQGIYKNKKSEGKIREFIKTRKVRESQGIYKNKKSEGKIREFIKTRKVREKSGNL